MEQERERHSWRIDVGAAVDLEGVFEIAADAVLPPVGEGAPRALLLCQPGGFLSRRYFDPGDPADDEERSYSFADAMARRGFAVAMIDHLGVGDSSRPAELEDAYRLDVDAIVRANQCAHEEIVRRVRALYRLADEHALASVGVGHSMGSALTVAHQANHRPHRALVLQSFSTTGLPAFLQGDEASYAGDPERLRADMAKLVRARFGTPYPAGSDPDDPGSDAAFSVGTAPPLAEALLRRSATNLLGMAGFPTLVPGGYAPYAERIDVPVFVHYGDHDLGRANLAPPTLPNAPEVLAWTQPDSWHCHNVANTRALLWERTARWLGEILD